MFVSLEISKGKGKGKGKFHPRTGHEDPEGE
jgi:hypothetical protein